ncbi:ribulose bisphosphate carboxylase oxygenase chloroplastic [Micractinium conductrix]|uniref:Ribulose bisphosphate carboxylase/oxygenase activase, chloroplastic n=1 Tax=Micractinium conductrix TaxID=554055 RepID=A0A2P6VH33_9CHLO|nr:ribulose bisphosphate carboxylase oxygenase chloroplastic [Micractinium conductrix]|eukprot:PSC73399.1 ribulose bisphosphate carboxylase oxygenase chloroplastic [Micractinium conductrix]
MPLALVPALSGSAPSPAALSASAGCCRPRSGVLSAKAKRIAAAVGRGDGSYIQPAAQQQAGSGGGGGGGGGHAGDGGRAPRISFRQPKARPSSWNAKEAGGGRSADSDYLSELGAAQQYNINVTHGQRAGMIDSLFTGNKLGHMTDIADGSLRTYEFRTYNNIVGDYYIAPRFLEKVALHIAKNFLIDAGSFDSSLRCPLILGIWGGKGQGKSFQTELCFKKLGVEPIIMSAGELEHEWAGTPGKLIRERYRRAAEVSKVHGKLSCLMINDLDAGLGHFENTQITVNNQMVVGTLMNLCDNPTRVSIGQGWMEDDVIKRIPIIVTGNDFSTIFAPLVRDGRMDKFYWDPTEGDLIGILHQMYKDDGLSEHDMLALLRAFPAQTLDFFGALRASTYDGQIRDWIKQDVIHGDIAEENENMKELGKRLLKQEDLPVFEPVDLTLEMLMAEGRRLVQEQEFVNSMRLSQEYLKPQRNIGRSMIGLSG